MKQKVRRLSKSALSVLLSIVMVVSMIAVGMVSTTAKTETNNKIYFDATKWAEGGKLKSKVYICFLKNGSASGFTQEMSNISGTNIYYLDNNSVSENDTFGGMFFTNDSWNEAGRWDNNNSWNNISQWANTYTLTFSSDIESNHTYYFRASSAEKGSAVYKDKEYNDVSKTIEQSSVRNTDRVWAFTLNAISSVATTSTGTPATSNASDTAGGKVAVNAAYFDGWNHLSGYGDSTASSTTSTFPNAAKSSTVTFKVTQVYPGYEFDGWYSDATSTGSTNRLSENQNYTETVTGDYNGTITRYAHFHRGQATITTAASPSGAGTAQVSTSQSDSYGPSVTVQSD